MILSDSWVLINYLCADNSFLSSRFVPDFLTVANCYCLLLIFPVLLIVLALLIVPVFLIVPVLCFNDFQFKIDLSNFLILVDRVANWRKLRKAVLFILWSSRDSYTERLQPFIGGFNGILLPHLQGLCSRIIFKDHLRGNPANLW